MVRGTSRRKCYIMKLQNYKHVKGLVHLFVTTAATNRTRGHRRSTNAMNDRIFATAFPFCLLAIKGIFIHFQHLEQKPPNGFRFTE
jgi:hypothetical protein